MAEGIDTIGTIDTPSPVATETASATETAGASHATALADRSTVVHLAILVPLAVLVCMFQLGRPDWRDDSHSCAGQIIQEMVTGHGWVLPLRNGIHIPVKPPLYYWFGTLSATVRHSGVDVLDADLPSAIMAVLMVLAVYLFARAAASGAVAFWAALMLISTPQLLIEARDPRVDMTFAFFVTAAIFLAYRVWDGQAGRRTAVLAGLCFGLATLSKGPLALALGGLVFAPSLVLVPPAAGWLALLSPATLLAAIGVPALWYAAATIEQGWAFLRLHIYTENIGRMLGEQARYPLWWYIEPFFTDGLPWMIAFPFTIRGESALPTRLRRFLWIWTAAMFVFFSISPGKRRVYLLVIRPALVILIAGWLVPQLAKLRARRASAATVPRPIYVGLAVLTLIGVGSRLRVPRAGSAASGRPSCSGATGGDSISKPIW